MTLRPGETARAYVEGRRAAYMNPLKYAFVCTTFYVLVIVVFDVEFFRPPQWQTGTGQEAFNLVMSLVPYLIFVELLPSAALQPWLYRKASYNVSECYVMLFFVCGHAVFYALVLALLGVGATQTGLLLIRLVPLPLLVWALVQFYRKGVGGAVLKAVLIHLVYLIFSVVAGVLTVWLFYRIAY